MNKVLSTRKLRLLAITGAPFGGSGNLIDSETGLAPRIPRGNACDIELGVFVSRPVAGAEPVGWDLSDVATLTLEILTDQVTAGELVDKSVAAVNIRATISARAWLAGEVQHATFECTNAELNLDLDGEEEVTYWCVITAFLDGGDEHTLAAGSLTLVEDQNASGGTPPANPGNTLSSAAIQAYVDSVAGQFFSASIDAEEQDPVIAWPGAPLAQPPSVVTFSLEGSDYLVGTIEDGSIDEDGFTIHLSSSDHSGLTAHVHFKM